MSNSNLWTMSLLSREDSRYDPQFPNKTRNLVTLLNDRSSGNNYPMRLKGEVTQKRANLLEVSRQSSLEHYYSSEITAIDLEKPQGRYLITGSEAGEIAIHDLWNLTTCPAFTAKIHGQHRSAHCGMIKCVQWDQISSTKVLTSGYDRRVKVWDVNPLLPILSFPLGFYINSHHISPHVSKNRLIAVGAKYPTLFLLDPNSGTKVQELKGHRIEVTMVQWSPSSEFLLASSGIDGRIFFWDIRSPDQYLKCLDQYNGLHDDYKHLLLYTAHNDSIDSIKFTNDGLMLVSHCIEGHVKLWNTKSGALMNRDFGYPIRNRSGNPITMDICWEAREPLLFLPCNLHLFLYNLATGTRMRTMVGHTGFVTGCTYCSASGDLYSCGRDSNIIKWTVNKISGLKRITREAWVWI